MIGRYELAVLLRNAARGHLAVPEGEYWPFSVAEAQADAILPLIREAETGCHCDPCPGRGNDGHGMEHCAECCFGTGVVADIDCPIHGQRESKATVQAQALRDAAFDFEDYAAKQCLNRGPSQPCTEACKAQNDAKKWLRKRADRIEAS
jgi:hypothetical protein